MKLLYLDDDSQYAKSLHKELLSYRSVLWELVHTVDLDEIFQQLSSDQFDVMLVDLRAPHGDPLAICERLCCVAPEVPLVVLSRMADTNIAIEAVRLGAQDYLLKGSMSGTQIMRRVRFAIERLKLVDGQQLSAAMGPIHAPAADVGENRFMVSATGSHSGTADRAPPHWPGPFSAHGQPLTGPLRLLHVEDDRAFGRLLQHHMEVEASSRVEIEQFDTLQPALKRLAEAKFSAILLDMSLPDAEGFDALDATLPHAGQVPILMLTGHDDESTAIQSIRRGAQDYLVKTGLDTTLLERSIRLAIARTVRAARPAKRWVEVEPDAFAPSPSGAVEDRRRYRRYMLTKPITVVPICSNNHPDAVRSGEALALDLSVGGIGFQISEPNRLPSRRWVVGIEADDGQPYFATVEVRNTQAIQGGLRLGAKFLSGDQDVLCKRNLAPHFDAATCRLATGLPTEVLERWAELGVIRPVLLDRIFVCPDCHALATFGNGCRACGSVQLASCQLIHHFACAHVGYVSEFEAANQLICPKCRTRGLIVGADFEFLNGPYRCLRCGFSDTELERVGCCLRCELRFPMHQAYEEELIGYHVNRLEPLALIDSP